MTGANYLVEFVGVSILRCEFGIQPPENELPDLDGLIGWWDFSVYESLEIVSGGVNVVDDLSGAGNHLGEEAVSNFPSYDPTAFNGMPGAVFIQDDINSQQGLSRDEFDFSGETLMFFAAVIMSAQTDISARHGSIVHYEALEAAPDAASFTVERINETDGIQMVRDGIPTEPEVTMGYGVPRRLIVTVETGGVMTIYLDGIEAATGTSPGTFETGGVFHLGKKFGASVFGHYFAGVIGEAGFCTDPNVAKVQDLDDYLKNKWGM